jgi:hypothetical protein
MPLYPYNKHHLYKLTTLVVNGKNNFASGIDIIYYYWWGGTKSLGTAATSGLLYKLISYNSEFILNKEILSATKINNENTENKMIIYQAS